MDEKRNKKKDEGKGKKKHVAKIIIICKSTFPNV